MKDLGPVHPVLRVAVAFAVVAGVSVLMPDAVHAGGLTNLEGAAQQLTQEAEGGANALGPMILIGLGIAVYYGFNAIFGNGLAALAAAAIASSATALWAGLGFNSAAGGGSIFDVTQAVGAGGSAIARVGGFG